MKISQNILLFLFVYLLSISCGKNEQNITNVNDYSKYLISNENKPLEFVKKEISFWQKKYDKAPNQISYLSILANNYSALFEITANIDYLIKAEELLVKSNEAYRYTNVGTIRSLARNYISQHKFKQALVLAKKAQLIGEGMRETQKLLFDVQLELGNYAEAEKNLAALTTQYDFDYFIRSAKWSDHKGDLGKAISLMEKAKFEAEKHDDKYLKTWVYSNLGDYNGHAGNIKQSYDYYLKTLTLDPNNTYALKGIAWIAFSHEKNTIEANRIIDLVSKKHNSPDFYLLKSQIAIYEKNNKFKNQYLANYFKMLDNTKYGAMYNRYNALLLVENKNTINKALEIAKIEVSHRPTPESYDLLAWTYYKLGDKKKALDIAKQHIEGKSFEPKLNYHLAVIYKANNLDSKLPAIKEELLSSLFELGPNYEELVKSI